MATSSDGVSALCHKLTRKKILDETSSVTPLRRCLNTLDLTMMGMGATIGPGIYVMTGVAAKDKAGPAIVISFLLAAVVICLAAACFTEFATRFRKTGSTYLYFYVSFGELPAFVMGWCIAVYSIFSGAVTARAWSAYLDNLLNGAVANFTENHIAEWTVGRPVSPFPDFVAAAFVAVLTVVIALGAKCTSTFNNIVVVLNVLILLLVAIVGFVYADGKNWTSKETGGFMPYGWAGILSGSGACFWALTGFEIISSTAEEARTPRKSIPIATGIVVTGVTLLYIAMSAAITLMTSYQNIDAEAPLPSAFEARGITWAQYVAAIGPMIGLLTMEANCIYSAVRFLYAIAEDGLLPSIFCKVNYKLQTPVVTSLVVGSLMCLMALFFDMEDLLGFSIIVSLAQHMGVAVSVILLRYRIQETETGGKQHASQDARAHYSVLDGEASPNQSDAEIDIGAASNGRNACIRGDKGTESSLGNYHREDGHHPSMDIESPKAKTRSGGHRKFADETETEDEDLARPIALGAHMGYTGHFLWEDLEGEGFTTGDDECTVFDARDYHVTRGGQESSYKAQEHARKNSLDVRFVTSSNEIGLGVTGDGDETERLIPSQPGGVTTVGGLRPRFGFMQSLFKPCGGNWVPTATFLVFVDAMLLAVALFYGSEKVSDVTWWLMLILCVLSLAGLVLVGSISIHAQSPRKQTFQVPCVPLLPTLTLLASSFLLVSNATPVSWIGLAIVFILSLLVYFSYSVRYSKLNVPTYVSCAAADGDRNGLLGQDETEDEM